MRRLIDWMPLPIKPACIPNSQARGRASAHQDPRENPLRARQNARQSARVSEASNAKNGRIQMAQLILRFVIGGAIVSIFAVIGDVLKPKSFAGLFAAAPSVALASLGLAVVSSGRLYAAQESRSMLGGAAAFLVYAYLCARLMIRYRFHAAPVTFSLLLVWFACSMSIWLLVLR
jgi:hypothetical protein